MALRTRSFVASIVAWEHALGSPAQDRRVLVVAHSTLNRVLLADCLGLPLRDYRRRLRQDWANLTVLRFPADRSAGPMLLLANDVSHLRGTSGATWDT